ncbi:MAG: hypothetical protein ACLFQV_12925, partial [Vulcanimicrobiota bacterium]
MLENLIRFSFPYPIAATYQNIESIVYPEEMPHKFNRLIDLYDSMLKIITYYLVGYILNEQSMDKHLQEQLEITLKNPTPSNWTNLLDKTLKHVSNSREPLVKDIFNFYFSKQKNLPKIRDAIYYMLKELTPAADVRNVCVADFFKSYNRFISEIDFANFNYEQGINILLPAFQEILMQLHFLKDYAMVYVSSIQIDGQYYDHNMEVMQGITTAKKRYMSEDFLPQRNKKMYLFRTDPETDEMEPLFCLHPFVVVRKCGIHNKDEIYFLRYRSGEEMDYYCFQCRERFHPDRLLIDFDDTLKGAVEAVSREVPDEVIEMYRQLLEVAWKDGIITDMERTRLEFLRNHFHLSKALTRNMEEIVKDHLGITGVELDLKSLREYEALYQNSIFKNMIISPLHHFIEQFRESLGIPREYAGKIESRIWYEEGLKRLNNGRTEDAIICFQNALQLDNQNLPASEKLIELGGEPVKKTAQVRRDIIRSEAVSPSGEAMVTNIPVEEEQETLVLKYDSKKEPVFYEHAEPAVKVGPVINIDAPIAEKHQEPAYRPRKRSKLLKAKKPAPVRQIREYIQEQPKETEPEEQFDSEEVHIEEQVQPEPQRVPGKAGEPELPSEEKPGVKTRAAEVDETYLRAAPPVEKEEIHETDEMIQEREQITEPEENDEEIQSELEAELEEASEELKEFDTFDDDTPVSTEQAEEEPISEMEEEVKEPDYIENILEEESELEQGSFSSGLEMESTSKEVDEIIESISTGELPAINNEEDIEKFVEENYPEPAEHYEIQVEDTPAAAEPLVEENSGNELVFAPSIEIEEVEEEKSPAEDTPFYEIEYESERDEIQEDDEMMPDFPSIEEVIEANQKTEASDLALWKEVNREEIPSSILSVSETEAVESEIDLEETGETSSPSELTGPGEEAAEIPRPIETETIQKEVEEELLSEEVEESLRPNDEVPSTFALAPDIKKEKLGTLLREANKLYSEKKYEYLNMILNDIFKLERKNLEGRVLKAKYHIEFTRDYQKALENLDEVAGPDTQDLDYLVLHGKTAIKCGKIKSAINDFSKALELKPENVGFNLARGFLFLELGNP